MNSTTFTSPEVIEFFFFFFTVLYNSSIPVLLNFVIKVFLLLKPFCCNV